MHDKNQIMLKIAYNAFGGHIHKDVYIIERYEPNELGKGSRATIVFLSDPTNPNSRIGVVDLLHPSEWNTPRCGNPNCRCMLLDEVKRNPLKFGYTIKRLDGMIEK